MLTGVPLFPGDSDIDQLALIIKTVGGLLALDQNSIKSVKANKNVTEIITSFMDLQWGKHVLKWRPQLGLCSLGRPPRWSDERPLAMMQLAQDRTKWCTLGKTYVQQCTAIF